MIDPSGPLSRGVYLRRRAIAVAGSVLGVVVLVWIIGALVGTDDGQPVRGTSAQVGTSSPPATTSAPAASSSAAATSAAPAPPPPTTTPPPDPNLPCPDAVVGVAAESDAPAYRVGRRPVLRLVVTNAGPVPCTRDIGHELRELLVTSPDGATRVWSSNDCYAPKGQRSQILQPGERQVFEVTWAGRTSAPGCPVKRTAVAPGAYLLTPKLGTLVGAPIPLAFTP
ncbi:hypothetical protein [Actinokineospora sp.]|uniref:hypothetical protein n=1 Tax=Actinokineospora sp. TaxID=1872133 RepID=UPI004037D1C6